MAARLLTFLGGVTALALVVSCLFTPDPSTNATKAAEDKKLLDDALVRNAKSECQGKRDRLIADYELRMVRREYREAADSLMQCAIRLGDPELTGKLNAANKARHIAKIEDGTTTAAEAVEAIHALKSVAPEASAKYEKRLATLEARAAKDDARAKKQRGVSIGATAKDIVASSWGRPERVNRTVNAAGTTEQWVYSPGNYLYLRNGILTGIQTASD